MHGCTRDRDATNHPMAALNVELQPGPQRTAAESTATIIFYGGAKGGGKSRWGAHESAKWFDVPGHTSIIFRRTYPELTGEGSLWEETSKIYPLLGGVPVESKLRWRFPSGATVALRHLQHVSDAYAWNGKNIGDIFLDELTFFEEEQFWILFSCQRAGVGGPEMRPRVRATMNPDPDSWVCKFVEWYLDPDGFAIPERSGVVRWFGRRNGALKWYASEEDAKADGQDHPTSFTFVAAKVWDNPALLDARPEYIANLQALPPVQQARYLGGNWKVRAQAGDYFRAEWFALRGPGPLHWQTRGHPSNMSIIRRFRVWDLASTPHKGDTVNPEALAGDDGDPDWTRGLLFGLCRQGEIILLDMVSCRDTPGAVEALMCETHKGDGPRVECVVGHDPGQAGQYQMDRLEPILRKHGGVRIFQPVRATHGKTEYAAVASRLAHRGRILVQEGSWNAGFFNELEAFPNPKRHDDQVDVLSMGVMYALEQGGTLDGLTSPGISRAVRTLNLDLRKIGDLALP